MLKTETIKYSLGEEVTIMREGLTAGKKILKVDGYVQCPNNLFMRKDNILAYYSESRKYWVFERRSTNDRPRKV